MPMHNPPHPGGILKEALEAIPMSVTAFAKHLGVSRVALSRVINGQAGFTPEMSIRVSQAFGQGERGDIWYKMQNEYDFWKVSRRRRKKIRELQWEDKITFSAAGHETETPHKAA